MPRPIIVAGSMNVDLVVGVSRLPQPGETVLGLESRTLAGGKGGNQACAAARLGGTVRMVGCVGADAFGRLLVDSLRSTGVDVDAVRVVDEAPTGLAMITVDEQGRNQIVVASGANARLTGRDVEAALADAEGGLLLLQLESPLDAVIAAAAAAKARGFTVILDPAPARPLPETLLRHVDILTPNEHEAMTLLGSDGRAMAQDEGAEIARALQRLGVDAVVLTLGARGAIVADGQTTTHHRAPQFAPVDTTAAGDTFNGAVAVALSEERPLAEAVDFANVAAALSVTRHGAQPSMPTRREVDDGRGAGLFSGHQTGLE